MYAIYPDAHTRGNEDLENFFSTRSVGGKQVITAIVSTFKALCEQADFSPVIIPPSNGNLDKPIDIPAKRYCFQTQN